MTSLIEGAEVMRVDRRGRVRVPVERREALLEEFERSGLSGAAFAKLSGIKYATFANWVTKRRGKSGAFPVSVGSGIRFLEAEASGPLIGVVVELPGGGRVLMQQATQAALVAALLKQMSFSSAC